MATLNDIYVFIESEELKRDTSIPQHPVEKGLPLSDTIKNEPMTLSISGKLVDVGNLRAEQIIWKIEDLRRAGSIVNYRGRNKIGGFLIKSFSTSHPNTNWGGADFNMELVEVRTAKSAYDPKAQTSNASVKSNPTIAVGSIVVFLGGSVYVSSDAKKPAANRARSTCKVTKISTKSWSVHQYHLISQDGKKVYGWVDKSRIEGAGNAGTASVTNGGTQQVKSR